MIMSERWWTTDSDDIKMFQSAEYNYVFNKRTGMFARWGATKDDDPDWSPFGPEIADIEISKNGCPGYGAGMCAYCYKSNTKDAPTNMTLATFKHVLDILGPQLTQVAFGITGVKTNPDFFAMMEYCRERGVIPNFTLSGADLDAADVPVIAALCGAVAVSYHGDENLCFNTVQRLHDAGMTQVNIHAVTTDVKVIEKLVLAVASQLMPFKALNALVLLSLKPKGRAVKMHNITSDDLRKVIELANRFRVPLGFDSCSAHEAMKVYPKQFHTLIEPCESGLFSAYIDAEGQFHPCSFAEGLFPAIDVTKSNDFMKDVWYAPVVTTWRTKLLAGDRRCPLF